ncbi:MAG: STM4504/CBY_0614 family protein [Pseudodesulfovibrio sp.]|uniref:STM4504/CBY_0614 family protein n=1 Tax=Pseudodesulfovibrio sp. TaxID=2035812 RepID=UPI003D14C4BD
MAIFFKRQRQARGEVPEVYQYEMLPSPFRVQICHLFNDIYSRPLAELNQQGRYLSRIAKHVVDYLCREIGVFLLVEDPYSGGLGPSFRDYENELSNFILQEANIEYVLSAIEEVFSLVNQDSYLVYELNSRFKEHGIGYQFEGQLLRIDSQYIHQEAVKPTLILLSDKTYSGPQEEFLSAHEHYRSRRYHEVLVDALKAFESTMKVICDKRKWKYSRNDTAKKLIATCFENGLIPEFWQSHMSSLRSTLESGVPTVRNKMGGHGQGAEVADVPDHIAAYALHMTASAIVFLVQAEQHL